MIYAHTLGNLYRAACEQEIQAFKPGNVSIYSDGHGMTVNDFRVSAEVSAYPISNPDYSLGEKIYYSVKATRDAVGCNTNLGIILLCAPLIHAVQKVNRSLNFRSALNTVLSNTTLTDAEWAFKAITLATPGGLGRSSEQDVHHPATVTLTEAMAIASPRDRIALQYVTGYKDIFDFSVLRYNGRLSQWRDKNWATVFVYAELLSQYPDSHIERKHGIKYTERVALRMQQFLKEFDSAVLSNHIKQALYEIDEEFKSNGINPGTTADMTVATILSVLIEDCIAAELSSNKS